MKDAPLSLAVTGQLPAQPGIAAADAPTLREALHDDHQHLMTLSRDMAEAETAAARRALYADLRTLLDAHSRAEESVVYDAMLRLKGSKDSRDHGNEGIVEHMLIDQLLDRLARTDLAGTDAWQAHAVVLRRLLERHIDEEERGCFDAIAEHFSEAQQASMAEAFVRLRALAPKVEVVVSD